MNPSHVAAFATTCLLATAVQGAETDHAELREGSLEVLEQQFGAFRDAARNMEMAAVRHCDGEIGQEGLVQSLRDTWLAWAPLDAYQFGPIEQTGAVLKVGFWPDKKDYVGRGLVALSSERPEALRDPQIVATHSAAVQGLPAIERLLFTDADACPAVVGISANVTGISEALYTGWFADGGYADLARSAGSDNVVFQTDAEFTKLLYTAVDFELTRIADARLGRPLGTYDKPMPKRAEAWRSGLSLDIIDAQLAGIQDLLTDGFGNNIFGPNESWVGGVIDDARKRVDGIGAPLDQAVSDPATRVRAEGLQTKVVYLRLQFAQNVGPELGVDTGFSAADGD